MLVELHIEDLGVISEQKLLLGAGLTVVTGETGAGKTMLVEAINLLVGGRADAMMVRAGASEARVEGRFVLGGDEVVLSRVVPADGRSRAYVDGRLATVGQLAEHGGRAVEVHGQHAHQSLLAPAVQRAALDRFGRVDLSPLRNAHESVRGLRAELSALGGDERSRAREIDLLRFQVDELDAAGLSDPDEDVRLDAQEDVLAGAAAHREAGELAVSLMSGDEGAAIDRLGEALHVLTGRAPFGTHAERLRSAVTELTDIASEVREAAEAIEEDAERLAAVRARRQLLRELRRKYGETLAEVLTFAAEVRQRLSELESFDERAGRLQAELAAALADEVAAAAAVRAARMAAAPTLAAAVEEHLRELAMPHARLEVSVGGGSEEPGAVDAGDDVSFLLAANPGTPPLPLTKVASGGELARTMLALRLVLTEAPETLLFDEVDAGIGGEAAVAVGRSLAALGQRHQVLVVTHLAQVAALADHHLVVRKSVHGSTTTTEVSAVSGDERVGEVARMLSGGAGSAAAREHAVELLAGAPRRRRR